nr:MAG TPA: hypothetical protein [Caudoviricetes sp.]
MSSIVRTARLVAAGDSRRRSYAPLARAAALSFQLILHSLQRRKRVGALVFKTIVKTATARRRRPLRRFAYCDIHSADEVVIKAWIIHIREIRVAAVIIACLVIHAVACRLEHLDDISRAVLHCTAPDHVLHDVRVLVRIEPNAPQCLHGGQVVRIANIVVLHARKSFRVNTSDLAPCVVKVCRRDRELTQRARITRIGLTRRQADRPVEKAPNTSHAARKLIESVTLAARIILSGRDRCRAPARFIFCTQISKHLFFSPRFLFTLRRKGLEPHRIINVLVDHLAARGERCCRRRKNRIMRPVLTGKEQPERHEHKEDEQAECDRRKERRPSIGPINKVTDKVQHKECCVFYVLNHISHLP